MPGDGKTGHSPLKVCADSRWRDLPSNILLEIVNNGSQSSPRSQLFRRLRTTCKSWNYACDQNVSGIVVSELWPEVFAKNWAFPHIRQLDVSHLPHAQFENASCCSVHAIIPSLLQLVSCTVSCEQIKSAEFPAFMATLATLPHFSTIQVASSVAEGETTTLSWHQTALTTLTFPASVPDYSKPASSFDFLEFIPNASGLSHIAFSNHPGFSHTTLCLLDLTSLISLQVIHTPLSNLPQQLATSFPTLKTLSLPYNRITSLPVDLELPLTLQSIDLSSNLLTDLPHSLSTLTQLSSLSLPNNKLRSFPSLHHRTPLKFLNISSNELATIPDSTVLPPSLTYLELASNRLREFPDVLCTLPRLVYLGINGNGISWLPQTLTTLTSLQTLTAASNRLSSLPPTLRSLTHLSLTHNCLSTLPPNLTTFTALRNLDLSDNSLTALPPSFAPLTLLQHLDLFYNSLPSLPDFPPMPFLTSLQASCNRLTTLPPSITCLTALKVLNLCNNALTTLPPHVSDLQHLTALLLHCNKLVTLPDSITSLRSLQLLHTPYNRLTSLPASLGSLSLLSSLRVEHNQLTSLPPSISALTSLSALSASNNKLNSLPPTFPTSLQDLNLSNNMLKSLPSSLGDLHNLVALEVSYNHLRTLPSSLKLLTSLQKLYASNNYISQLFDHGICTSPTSPTAPSFFQRTCLPSTPPCPPSSPQARPQVKLHIKAQDLSFPSPAVHTTTCGTPVSALQLPGSPRFSDPSWSPRCPSPIGVGSAGVGAGEGGEGGESCSFLPSLRVLSLEANRLMVVPQETQCMSSLRHLNVVLNQIESIPDALMSNPALSIFWQQ